MMFGGVTSEVVEAIDFAESGEQRLFSLDGEPFTSYTRSDHAVPEALRDTFKTYLIAEQRTHRMVKEMILAEGTLFDALSYRYRVEQLHDTDIAYRLTAVRSEPSAALEIPEGFERRAEADERVLALIDRAAAETPLGIDGYAAEMERLIEAGQHLEAMLAFYECINQHGEAGLETTGPLLRAAVERGSGAGGPVDLGQMAAAIGARPDTEQGLRDAIAVIEEAKRHARAHGHILNVFMANHYGFLEDQHGRPDQNARAAALILDALDENPLLAGAWYDLGWKYFRMFQMPWAWAAWDQARAINPEHPLIAGVTSLEQQVEHNNPDYFP